MRSIISFFTSNFGLKILALILAIIVFYAGRDSLVTARSHSDSPIFRRSK